MYNAYRHRKPSRFAARDGLLAVLVTLLLAACGSNQPPPQQDALDIDKGDACAVCGMYIDAGPGPRGEAWVQGYKAPLKFGSTRDFFAYVLDPENQTRLQQLLVQDSAQINWQHPSNAAATFVDARSAWYVAWQPLTGLMGPTFASFAARQDADAFMRAHGGELLRFSEVTPQLTSLLGSACPVPGSPAAPLAKACVAAPHAASGSPLAAQDEHFDLLHRRHTDPLETDPAAPGHQHAVADDRAH
ncbi:nitrous oxide reductase accessory protein NosL [Rhodanobacter sp. AS-Z3]|uniref:nitrous oxide reductase accessory protein NosL n=1 Tax=Rhodanobacter sp. AS-Z3 TaxID=3031330 RepID=UPI0024783CE6|nr:nitrous oxide reductase accessory protein NosL [Rhodanobacter sp. AS-Z3]WEN14519.1 nitrous oxide reductase accessory protein NosL [Rhodanobacter sp. AS-Z3]